MGCASDPATWGVVAVAVSVVALVLAVVNAMECGSYGRSGPASGCPGEPFVSLVAENGTDRAKEGCRTGPVGHGRLRA